MQSVWRQAVQLDTRLAQPEVGRKALSPFVTAAGHPWLVAPLPLVRLIEMVGVAIAATDLAAGPENVVALLSRRLVARPDVVGLLDAHPGPGIIYAQTRAASAGVALKKRSRRIG